MDDADTPSFDELEADPEIAPLLDFTPVPRQIVKANGWSGEMQRVFIGWLAHFGVPERACSAMRRSRAGVDKLYRDPDGASFREAWDAAVALAARRRLAEMQARRPQSAQLSAPTMSRGKRAPEPDPAPEEVSEERKWELIHSIGLKFMRKVAAEREARRNGEIVAADFYLRQITFLEVMLEMTSAAFGWDVQAVLTKLRRGDHHITAIVNTELSDWMDRSRRAWWAQEGEPERPAFPDVRFLEPRRDRDGAYGTAIDQGNLGACARPARGYDADTWAALTLNEQSSAWQRQYEEDAAEQANWEARAFAEHNERTRSDK
jgi:hypothetical protein